MDSLFNNTKSPRYIFQAVTYKEPLQASLHSQPHSVPGGGRGGMLKKKTRAREKMGEMKRNSKGSSTIDEGNKKNQKRRKIKERERGKSVGQKSVKGKEEKEENLERGR